jgi:hypothetical protein
MVSERAEGRKRANPGEVQPSGDDDWRLPGPDAGRTEAEEGREDVRAFLAKLRFLMAYTAAQREGKSHGEAIHAGLTRLATRKPFNVLTPDDIKRIVPVWSLIPDPRNVAQLVANNVRENNAHAMKDKWFLDQLAAKYRAIKREAEKRQARRR